MTERTNSDRKLTWDEVGEYAELVAAFHGSAGRDPNPAEHEEIIVQARALVKADGSEWR